MNTCKITVTSNNVDNNWEIEVREIPLYIKPSKIDRDSPEMYNYTGEQLFFVEVPYDALIVDGIERASGKVRTVMTLAKMERSIAAGGKSYKINPAYGVETSQIESYSFTTKGGKVMTVTPQEGQYRFYSNRGITKILGILEQTGNLLDFVNILTWGMDSSDKKKLLPLPGPLSVLNLPMKDYFDNIDEAIEEHATRQLEIAKKESMKAVEKLVSSPMYKKMGYHMEYLSDDSVKKLQNGEIKTEREFMNAVYCNDHKLHGVLFRIVETRKDVILMIETFFFDID